MLYPLKFKPILKERLWGGCRLGSLLGKKYPNTEQHFGESWDLSAVEKSESVVTNGFLKGNTLAEIAEIYMSDLLGESVYEAYGDKFPLLIKFIDSAQALSVQVHPNDEMAQEQSDSFGKNEMWYVMEAEPDSEIIVGFTKPVNRLEFASHIKNDTVSSVLKSYKVAKGDFFYIPAGTIHAIGKGVLLLEVQQSSDITYRIYDWGRTDSNGNPRELHQELALQAIDFELQAQGLQRIPENLNVKQRLIECPYFNVSRWVVDKEVNFDLYESEIDSFVIIICIEGIGTIVSDGNSTVSIKKGELVLIPAEIANFTLVPKRESVFIEVNIPERKE
jgi:mannose-6-phosphate isomerase